MPPVPTQPYGLAPPSAGAASRLEASPPQHFEVMSWKYNASVYPSPSGLGTLACDAYRSQHCPRSLLHPLFCKQKNRGKARTLFSPLSGKFHLTSQREKKNRFFSPHCDCVTRSLRIRLCCPPQHFVMRRIARFAQNARKPGFSVSCCGPTASPLFSASRKTGDRS